MEKEIAELKKALATAFDLLSAQHASMTDQMVELRAVLEAAKETDPNFEDRYRTFLKDPSALKIRDARSFQFVPISEALQSLRR